MADMDGGVSLRSLLEALPNSENKQETLTNIRTALSFVSANSLRDIAPGLSYGGLFEHLRSSDSNEITVCCEILEKLLSAVDVGTVLSAFNAELLLGLTHWSTDVRLLCLKQVYRAVLSNASLLLQCIDIINSVVSCFCDDSGEIAQRALQICTEIGKTADGRDLLLRNNRVFPSVQAAAQKGDVIRYRIYEMLVSVSVTSPEALQAVSDCGLLSRLLNELQVTDDILLRLNCLELLTTLAGSKHGLSYLEDQRVLADMETMLRNVDQDPFSALLLPGIVKFFGNVCHGHPADISGRFREIFSILLSSLKEGPSGSLTGIAVETLGFVGQTVEGKRGLDKLGEEYMRECFKQLGKFMNEAATELKVKSLETIRQLMHVGQGAEITNDLSTLTEQWFTYLSATSDPQAPLRRVLEFSKQPFTEVRLPSLRLVGSMARLAWAQHLLHSEPGFNEYLLDRSTEVTKEGLEEKYEIVRALVASSSAVEVFGWEYVLRLKNYERDGPFYIRHETQVAMDNAQ